MVAVAQTQSMDEDPTDAADLLEPARGFLHDLHGRFEDERQRLLARRRARQAEFDAGAYPDFLASTRDIREGDWQVAPIPAVLADRRVEITGPVERKLIINALNSGAKVFMADFEDSTAPTWGNLLRGQANLRDAVAGTLDWTAPDGRHYDVGADPAVLMVRPRGWHLPERHFEVAGVPMAGALFDFGLFAFHNAAALHACGRGPYFYLPKLESHLEAALWNAVLDLAEDALGLPRASMKVTVLIETLPAAFEMHEILHALRTRVTALNCGRWDYIFSTIKVLRAHRDRVLPERPQITMSVPFLRAYSELLVATCHRRGALAMGGMAAHIPIRGDAAASEAAFASVRADKLREVRAGHDGTWVAHPALVPVARAVFDEYMPTPNQLHVQPVQGGADREALLAPCAGTITRAGFAGNIEVCLAYLAAWLDGSGCVPIHHLMEDAATAEIARSQLWQWLHRDNVEFDDGAELDQAVFAGELARVRAFLAAQPMPGKARIGEAAELLEHLTRAPMLPDFLTLAAYPRLP